MKRYLSTRTKDQLLELIVDISYVGCAVEANSKYDLQSSGFYSFESNLLDDLEIRDFEIIDSYESDNEGSNSRYYIAVKTTEDGTKLRIFLKIRVSDHEVEDDRRNGKFSTFSQRDSKYVSNQAKEYAQQRFSQKRGYRSRRLDIVFDDTHYTSFESALRDIEDKLDEFDQ